MVTTLKEPLKVCEKALPLDITFKRRHAEVWKGEHAGNTYYRVVCSINDVVHQQIDYYQLWKAVIHAQEFLQAASWVDFFAARPPVRRFGKY
jgi:hypothetical protein